MRFRPHPDVVDTELGGAETVLLHLETTSYFTLNATGSRIWREVKREAAPEEISRRLQGEFEVEAEEADRSVQELLEELLRSGLVQVVTS